MSKYDDFLADERRNLDNLTALQQHGYAAPVDPVSRPASRKNRGESLLDIILANRRAASDPRPLGAGPTERADP